MRPDLQNLPRNLFVVLCASQLPRLLCDALADDAHQWQAHDAAMHLCVSLLVGFAGWMIPYHRIAAKCIAFAWLGFELVSMVESVLRLFDFNPLDYVISIQAGAALMLAIWYLSRSYAVAGDVLDDTHLFICRLRPRSAQDVIMAMLGRGGLGGVAIYYRNHFWQYKHGILVRENGLKNAARYVAFKSGIPEAMTIRILDNMVGSKWSPIKNCITMLYATAKTGAPIFKHWR
jgi:hypothetical protein